MSSPEVAVVDYGVGNLLSVKRALEQCGARVSVSADPEALRSAPRVVLPGVGAFADGMAELRARGLESVVVEIARRGTPLLGICLGMQMLLDESEEFGVHAGLGLIPGRVVAIPRLDDTGAPHKIPHIGWNGLVPAEGRGGWGGTLLERVQPGEAVYFVHSYGANPSDPACRVADCVYGGARLSAVIARENVAGCQFHPEKSGPVGLRILSRFLES